MKRYVKILGLLLMGFSSPLMAGELPELLLEVPSRPVKTLGPVGAGGKEIPDARKQLQREAAKMDADAIIAVKCSSGGVKRYGLTWAKETAYCRGMAVQYEDATPKK